MAMEVLENRYLEALGIRESEKQLVVRLFVKKNAEGATTSLDGVQETYFSGRSARLFGALGRLIGAGVPEKLELEADTTNDGVNIFAMRVTFSGMVDAENPETGKKVESLFLHPSNHWVFEAAEAFEVSDKNKVETVL